MPILKRTGRFAAIALAVLFIGLSLFAILGVWFVDRRATDVVLKGFGLVETSVGVVDAGVGRVDDLIATSRTEVRQASETITAVGAQAQANSPVLNALNERLETSLAPRIAQMQQVLAPVRDALGNVANAVSLLNSLPMMADHAPRLAALDETEVSSVLRSGAFRNRKEKSLCKLTAVNSPGGMTGTLKRTRSH